MAPPTRRPRRGPARLGCVPINRLLRAGLRQEPPFIAAAITPSFILDGIREVCPCTSIDERESSKMIPAPSYEHVDRILNEDSFDLDQGSCHGIPRDHNVVGFLIFDQNFQRDPINDFIRNIEFLDLRSGRYIHFFPCGVSKHRPNQHDASKEIGEASNGILYHSASALCTFIKAFEENIPGWTYNIGVRSDYY